MFQFIQNTIAYVYYTLVHNAPSLLLGIFTAALIKVYVNPNKFKALLLNNAGLSIPGSVAFGAFTPFCACGTMAVILSMLTTALPWGPIMAFLTSSPLMSPDKFILLSGIIGLKFAAALAAASVLLGLGAGYITHLIERKSSFLDNQTRFASEDGSSCGCEAAAASCCTPKKTSPLKLAINKYKLAELTKVLYEIGIKRILVYFSLFAALGYMINQFVPTDLISLYLGTGNLFAVPLSALIGLPLYISGSSSIPIIKTLLESGASEGAMLAFMITGPGTSAGVIAGITAIIKKKAVVLYVAYIFIGAILLGYLFDFINLFL